jgi:hypothetical protein
MSALASRACDGCRVLTREDCLARTELLARGEWVCERCEDELVSEQHELDRADAYDAHEAETGPCRCEHCARHRAREARKIVRQWAAKGAEMAAGEGKVVELDPWRVSVHELRRTEADIARMHREGNSIGVVSETQILLVRALAAICDGHHDPRGLAEAALTIADRVGRGGEP